MAMSALPMSDDALHLDLFERTWQSLDWRVVMASLAEAASTSPGRRLARSASFAGSHDECLVLYEQVGDVRRLSEQLPFATSLDIGTCTCRSTALTSWTLFRAVQSIW